MPLPKFRFQWMSHQEIEMVLRQQLHHIQSPDPMSDDFYAQVMNARKGGGWKGVGIPALNSVRIQNLKRFRNADGSPRNIVCSLLWLVPVHVRVWVEKWLESISVRLGTASFFFFFLSRSQPFLKITDRKKSKINLNERHTVSVCCKWSFTQPGLSVFLRRLQRTNKL